ncbi:heterokaryon incompatibility protein-domain-containing protein [Aspergillus bertholletiae]|uniref:Heterokaryon incompatibility protein-domain-containing protein n=1 Tax=Aspergillus bertholletiae TaxID=1226010 RepID=A0A5N7BIC6_9EURO|nr:heterokaryon incompatibility protein-domain-containing protein [Aspergillus bertholletiae]
MLHRLHHQPDCPLHSTRSTRSSRPIRPILPIHSDSNLTASSDSESLCDPSDFGDTSDSPDAPDGSKGSSRSKRTSLPRLPQKTKVKPGHLAFRRPQSDCSDERRKGLLKQLEDADAKLADLRAERVKIIKRLRIYKNRVTSDATLDVLRWQRKESSLREANKDAVSEIETTIEKALEDHKAETTTQAEETPQDVDSEEEVTTTWWKGIETNLIKAKEIRKKILRAKGIRDVFARELHLEPSIPRKAKAKGSSNSAKPHRGTKQNPFSYDPIEPGQFRILVLHPAKNTSFPLVCTLHAKSLNDDHNPPYAALSYCWGSDSGQRRLLVFPGSKKQANSWKYVARHATEMPIRKNLFQALLRLRRKDVPIALWADAICINQQDEKEKTEQLQQMATIYRMADQVCVWLGEADSAGRSDRAMAFIPKIMDFAFLERLASDKKEAENWYALGELMRDRWFSRRWVVQEISLAKSAAVYCGAKTVQWAEFADAVSIFVATRDKIRELFDFETWKEGPQTLGEVQSFGASILLEATSRLFLRTPSGEILRPVKGIESLVTSLNTFDATDPRDIVYSLVSIASDTRDISIYVDKKEDKQATRSPQLVIDYRLDEIEVYQNFTKYCIESSGSLDLICRSWAMPPKKAKGTLPSWIRLLRDSEFGEPEEVYEGRKNGESLVGPVGYSRYNASGGMRFQPITPSTDGHGSCQHDSSTLDAQKDITSAEQEIIQQRPSTLWVRGFKLASIQGVSLVNAPGLIPRTSLRDIGGWPGINSSPESVPDHLWRTLIADRDSDGQIPPAWYQRACLRCLDIADTFNNGDLNVGQLLQGPSDMLRGYLTRVRNITWNRKFFKAVMGTPQGDDVTREKLKSENADDVPTPQSADDAEIVSDDETPERLDVEDGSFRTENDLFGLCPPGTKQGDFICILYGCSVPVVIRRLSSASNQHCFKVIGEAYVHGKMDGEALVDCKSGKTLGSEEAFALI